MNEIKNIIRDVLYVSRVSKTKHKKILIFSSVGLSQLSAFTDVALIGVFATLITDQFTNIDTVNLLLEILLDNKYLIIILVFLRYVFQYFQVMILKKIEFNVYKNLRIHLLNEIFDKRNYSTSDAYFYISTLSMHVSFFYNAFTAFLNSLFQIVAYSLYLFISDSRTMLSFGLGALILYKPLKILLKKSKNAEHYAYEKDLESNKEIERVVDNLILIKILKKDDYESERFSTILDSQIFHSLKSIKYGTINSFTPTFFTLLVLSLVLSFSTFAKSISLDFIGVTLRLFQSLSMLTRSLNMVNNSHVHIAKFYEMEKNKLIQNKENFELGEKEYIGFDNLTFKYFNSEDYIFEKESFKLPKNSHTVITGPNGSGKSTLLGLLSGVFYANNGKVSTFSDKYGYIGATPLIFNASLYDNLTYGNEERVDENELLKYLKLLDTFKEESNYNLEKFINNKSLSSGQMQKISFIRALVSNCDILLLDEATANLDDKSKEIIFDLLQDREITIINSTHDPESFKKVDFNLDIEIIDEKRIINLK